MGSGKHGGQSHTLAQKTKTLMAKASNMSHKTKGHPPSHNPHGPFKAVTGSSDVFIEGGAAIRKGDKFPPHTSSFVPNSRLTQGSSSVYVNGKALSRKGDKLNCGDSLAEGADNVSAG